MINTNTVLQNHLILPHGNENFVFNREALNTILDSIKTWCNIAQEEGINVDKQITKLQQIVQQAPSLDHPRINDDHEITRISDHEVTRINEYVVTLHQQIFYQSMYCNQIIRKVAIACIKEKLGKAALKSTNKSLIEIYQSRVWTLLPPKRCLRTISIVEDTFKEILQILQLMEEEIERDNQGINAFNLPGGCGS